MNARLDLDAIKARNIDSLAADAPYNADVWTLAADRDALVAAVERLRALPAAWVKAAAEQQSIARGEVPDLPRDLALVARGRARQLEDCAAELTAALAEEQTGGERP